MWYKVTFDRGGAVLACVQISAEVKNGKTYVCVAATNSTAAIDAAKRLYVNNYRRAERADAKANGECRDCRRKLPEDYEHSRCDGCLEIERTAAGERRKIKRVLGLPKNAPLPKELRRKKTRGPTGYGAQTRERRRRILVEVREKLDSMSRSAFRVWLLSEIARASGDVAAAPLRLVK